MTFLNRKWCFLDPDKECVKSFSQELNISPILSRILINRSINNAAAAKQFLFPRLSFLSDPLEIPHMAQALEVVQSARQQNKKVCVFGDYDVDGVSSSAILIDVLRKIGFSCEYYIPHRRDEGYGLNLAAIKKIKEQGVELIITVDCGVSNHKEIALAHSLNMQVVVTDHHNVSLPLPEADAIVNPKLIKGESSLKYLAGVGVAFKFAWALLRLFKLGDAASLAAYLDLAALGTIADVVPLIGENRILVVHGLKHINAKKRKGLSSLAEAANLKSISIRDVNFGLAPRLNAAGRLEHANLSLSLLLEEEEQKAKELAQELNRVNSRRQGIGEEIQKAAFARIEKENMGQGKMIFVDGQSWHTGVIGIAASKISDRYFRPTVLVGVENGLGRGSARSIENFDIFSLLNSCRDLFIDFGGHRGAAGFSILENNISQLNQRLKENIEPMLTGEDLQPIENIDAILEERDLTLDLQHSLVQLEPYGGGNCEPVFVTRAIKLRDISQVGRDGAHLKLKIDSAQGKLDAIGFSLGHFSSQLNFADKYNIAYNLRSNVWNESENLQLNLIDMEKT